MRYYRSNDGLKLVLLINWVTANFSVVAILVPTGTMPAHGLIYQVFCFSTNQLCWSAEQGCLFQGPIE